MEGGLGRVSHYRKPAGCCRGGRRLSRWGCWRRGLGKENLSDDSQIGWLLFLGRMARCTRIFFVILVLTVGVGGVHLLGGGQEERLGHGPVCMGHIRSLVSWATPGGPKDKRRVENHAKRSEREDEMGTMFASAGNILFHTGKTLICRASLDVPTPWSERVMVA